MKDAQKSSLYWCFYGKIAAKALFNNEDALELLSARKVGAREFIAFTKERQKPVKVLEIILKAQPVEKRTHLGARATL